MFCPFQLFNESKKTYISLISVRVEQYKLYNIAIISQIQSFLTLSKNVNTRLLLFQEIKSFQHSQIVFVKSFHYCPRMLLQRSKYFRKLNHSTHNSIKERLIPLTQSSCTSLISFANFQQSI